MLPRALTGKLLAILSTAALVSACATGDRVTRVLDESGQVDTPFSRLLVVGAHTEPAARRRFEEGVAEAINDTESLARTSLEFMNSDVEINRDSVLAAVEEAGADAVLITRLVDLDVRRETEAGRTTIEARRRDSIPMADFFRYEYVEYQDPMTVTTVQTVVLATDLYRVADESRIWSVESRSVDKTSAYDFVDSISRALTNALTNDGLIR